MDAPFDAPDRLNDDGTVTFRIIPSNWHGYNVSPDTYQTVNGDSWGEMELEYLSSEMSGEDFLASYGVEKPDTVEYDDFEWSYDHRAIVASFSETLCNWISERLMDAGLDSLRDVSVVDSWSPAYYNFTSDGFEMELTCDPAQLREISPDFDAEDWAHEHYRSYDGFMSFVTSRMNDPEWRAGYDAEFRVESILKDLDPYGEREWVMALVEDEYEVYMEHTTVTADVERIRERLEYRESGYTERELEEWADLLTPTQTEVLF